MGAVGGLLGLGGGAAGTSFQGPQQANITAPTNTQQIGQAYTGTQNSLAAQNNLLSALQAQNGLGNQSQVYGQLQGIASGAVNPAQAQFAQNTSQNVANQAALMAGQRGANQNVGLIARQAAQQGAATQQQAIGQEAAQQAQNQINAIGAAGNLATTQAQQQIGQTNANTQAQQAEQANLLNALQGYNTNQVQSQASVNAGNAALANTQLQGQQGLIGGALQGASLLAAAAGGGEIKKMASGGDPSQYGLGVNTNFSPSQSTQSEFGQFLAGVSGGQAQANNSSQQEQLPQSGPAALQKGMSGLVQAAGPAVMAAAGANGGMANDFRAGGRVNAKSSKEKAVAKGNNYSNDKIPAVLSEHEIVLPRSVTMSKDPVKESAKFVAQIIAKRRAGK